MTAFVRDTTTIGTTIIYESAAINDSVTFLQGLTFFNTSSNAVNILHGNNTVYNMATIMSGGAYGLVVNFANDCEIVNTATGTIASLSGFGGYSAVYLAGDRNTLLNMGTIFSTNGAGVILLGDDVIIDNSGMIQGRSSGVEASGVDYTLLNSGTIESGTSSISVAVNLSGSGLSKSLVNTGVIQSLAPATGIAVQVTGSNLTTIDNSGTIRSVGGVAIDASTATGAIHLTNSGAIIGSTNTTFAVGGTGLADTIINSGSINRSIAMLGGDDRFNGIGGTVGGTVFGGAGNDIYRLSDPLADVFEALGEGTADRVEAAVSYSLVAAGEVENLTLLGTAVVGTGNALNNVMIGSQGDNRLFGLAGNDVIYGGTGAGADRLVGGAGNDSLYGYDGNDALIGNSGNDRLDGMDDDDLLIGGIGNDILYGRANEDRLIGGAGRDLLNGGTESDTFVFQNRSDSGTTATTRDTIYTYALGVDVVDLSGVDANINLTGNQAFAFAAGGVFTNVAGQLIVQVSGANRLLLADLDGNGTADFSVEFAAVSSISVNDLVL